MTAMETERIEPAPLGPVVQLCSVGGCFDAPVWRIFAAYEYDREAVHPTVAHYRVPLFKACPAHLSTLMASDGRAPHSSDGYYVEPIR